jgi:hypothetical protein
MRNYLHAKVVELLMQSTRWSLICVKEEEALREFSVKRTREDTHELHNKIFFGRVEILLNFFVKLHSKVFVKFYCKFFKLGQNSRPKIFQEISIFISIQLKIHLMPKKIDKSPNFILI